MKSHLFLAKLAVLGVTLFTFDANAQPKSQLVPLTTTPQILAQNLSVQERRELQILRKEREKVQQEREIRNLVQAEVDRAFSRLITLINILLFVMTLFPALTVLGIWLLRRTIINQLVAEIKQELQSEVEKQTAAFKQEMEQLQREYVAYFSQLQAWAKSHPEADPIHQDEHFTELIDESNLNLPNIESNYVTESSENQQFINSEDKHFIPGESQTLMAQDQYEMSSVDPNSPTVTSELNNSKTQVMSIDDYLQLGNSYLSKSRYQEAIEAYNEALKIERNSPEARYQNAKAYALRGSINPAIGNLQWAIDLDLKYKEMAKTDKGFDYIRMDEQFQQLIND